MEEETYSSKQNATIINDEIAELELPYNFMSF